MRLIGPSGDQLGIKPVPEALRMARGLDLDLVEVASNANPPVCRIMDYGKFKYEEGQKAKEARKKSSNVSVKEVKYRPKIDKHDFDYKTNHAREFLQAGNKVKLTIMFRGREMAHPEFGREILGRVVEATSDLLDDPPDARRARLEGRNMVLMLTPGKNAQKAAHKEAQEKQKEVVQEAGQEAGEES